MRLDEITKAVSVHREEKRTTDSPMAHLITTTSGEKSRDQQKRMSGRNSAGEEKPNE